MFVNIVNTKKLLLIIGVRPAVNLNHFFTEVEITVLNVSWYNLAHEFQIRV